MRLSPSSRAASRTSLRVASLTLPRSLITRSTVAGPTPALSATSPRVTLDDRLVFPAVAIEASRALIGFNQSSHAPCFRKTLENQSNPPRDGAGRNDMKRVRHFAAAVMTATAIVAG